MLAKMYKRNLDKIAKEKGIPRNNTKIEIVRTIAKKLKMQEVRDYYSKFKGTAKFSVLNHNLVPKHKILSDKEKIELKKKFKIAYLKQLPKIKLSDPAVLVLGGSVGDVIEITRNDLISGENKYYRVVIK